MILRIQRQIVCGLLAALAFAGISAVARANGMRLVSQDAFAASRGEAFAATADNPSAIYYNPAGITQLQGHNVRGGLNLLYFDPTFQPPSDAPNRGTTYHIEENVAAAPQLFYVHSWTSVPISAGIGVYAPYGASVTWPQDTGFRTVAIEGALTYIRANPVLAVELTPGLSLACGVLVDYGEIDVEQGLRATEKPLANRFRFTGDNWGVGYNLGLRWQPNPKVAVGASFRSITTLNFKGHTDVVFVPTVAPTETPASLQYEFPLTAVFGVSYRPTPRWNLEVNLDYTDWSTFNTATIYQDESPGRGIKQVVPVDLHWKPSWMYAFGVSHYLTNGWQFSAGYLFNQNSVPDDYYSPLVADLDRHFLSVGTGYRGQRWGVDIAYQFGYGPQRVVSGSEAPSQPGDFAGQNGDGTYEWISHAVLVSVGLRF